MWKDFHNIAPISVIPTAVDTIQEHNAQTTKILRNGQIFILRGDKVYTVTGQEVK